MMVRLYRRPQDPAAAEECFYVDFTRKATAEEIQLLKWLIADPFSTASETPRLADSAVVEIGPRLSVETSFSSNAVAICRSIGLPVARLEKSVRHPLASEGRESIVARALDWMTQEIYPSTLSGFGQSAAPEPVTDIGILQTGEQALREANARLGLGMDSWDIGYYTALFQRLGRNPTVVECFQLGNANSEHSRHWFFRGIQVIDGEEKADTLFAIVQEPWKRNPANSLTAFKDNAGVLRGGEVAAFAAIRPGQPSPLGITRIAQHITATSETHNHPTMIAPFPGAETGAGGRIRDNRAVGRGGLAHAGIAGYCVGNLHIPGFAVPGETIGGEADMRQASPLAILMKGSDGVSDYGNKIGEPLIAGFTRSFGQRIAGARREFRKPVLYSGGIGRVNAVHVEKRSPETGMSIVRIGGPAYRIGVGGGSASSITDGANQEALDFQSVQRGDAEMENRVNRVIQACAELGAGNPIESLHDQGAGGPSNVLTELMEPLGGRIDIRKIALGDRSLSVLEIWGAEYQEGYGLLVRPENLGILSDICARERVNCESLGEITGDGKVVVVDTRDGSTPVSLALDDILSGMPQKRFVSERGHGALPELEIPRGLTVEKALRDVFLLPQVGSKGFLVRKADRSVTGLVARQQCCGPAQIPVADCAVTADGYFGLTGAATAIGEQPVKMLLSPAAGARMAVSEMLCNLAGTPISALGDVKCRANWMWAAKLPGEGALLYDAAIAMRDIMIALGIAIDGGKDSLSMSARVGSETAIAPGQLVILGYAPVPDITKPVTPDFKGDGHIGFIDLGLGRNRLGGSSLAQSLGQTGKISPDIDDPDLFMRAFRLMQRLVADGLVTAYHDRSDGGLVTALAEMCMAGQCGATVEIKGETDALATLFCEEAGMVFEFGEAARPRIHSICREHGIDYALIGATSRESANLRITVGATSVLDKPVTTLRQWWEATSTRLEAMQANPQTVASESASHVSDARIAYKLTFAPAPTPQNIRPDARPKIAILREEGTNGDREMAVAFHAAGCEPWDISVNDLAQGRVTDFAPFQGLVFPGGFSYADVFGSAKGWAATLLFNPRIRRLLDEFYERRDTFSLGVCNGCQLMANIGWVPARGYAEDSRPRLVHNASGRFESRWSSVRIAQSPSVLLRGMEGSVLGIHVAHGEGRMHFPDPAIAAHARAHNLVPMMFADPAGEATRIYPYNPNGSPEGWAALCSQDGRHLAMMPHPERCFLKWQWPWMPEDWRRTLAESPWLRMFQNARDWCLANRG